MLIEQVDQLNNVIRTVGVPLKKGVVTRLQLELIPKDENARDRFLASIIFTSDTNTYRVALESSHYEIDVLPAEWIQPFTLSLPFLATHSNETTGGIHGVLASIYEHILCTYVHLNIGGIDAENSHHAIRIISPSPEMNRPFEQCHWSVLEPFLDLKPQ